MQLSDQLYLETQYGCDAIEEMAYQEHKNFHVVQDILNELDDMGYKQEVAIKIIKKLLMTQVNKPTGIHELVAALASYTNGHKEAYNLIKELDGTLYKFKYTTLTPKYKLHPDIITIIEDRHYIPPFLIKPKKWTNNKNGGYQTINKHIILGSHHNKHNKKQALDVINILQDIEWVLDQDIIAMEEESNKPLEGDALVEFKRHVMQSKNLYESYSKHPFYFMWRYDKRGRIYSEGYHINLQSTGYKKASLNFNEYHTIEGSL